ncbi:MULTISPECIES: FecR domain-containing protein [Pseudomonas]|uniref:Iron transporter n=2 Tax=Pseudomonas TaxID=286 RepID=A0A0G3GS63_9PSED|nr:MULTISPECIES: FecR domain-containing protein [Pseudomonas]AKK01607.1 iron transporter [Pseudomonas chlororaphis]ROM82200.1 iron transporter [Pseudomonas brassicacearum]BBP67992.1 sensor [Pseudomonas sp. Cab53]
MPALPDRKTVERAATWYVQFQHQPPSHAERQAWQDWLDSDPAHQAAWHQIEQLQRHLGALPQDLSRRALGTGQHRRQVLKLLMLLGGAGSVGWSLQDHGTLASAWADYKTAVGQRRFIDLADGSRIHLNTETAIDVSFDAHRRLIRLLSGEILVQTGKLKDTRPFLVETGDGRIEALGTRFTVRQLSNRTRVGVLEDRVRVSPDGTLGSAGILKAGEQADFNGQGMGFIQSYAASQAAWVNGQLIVLDAPLGDVIEELSRYRPGVLHCQEKARQLRVSGTLRLNATDAVLANLQASLPIQVRYYTRYWVSITRAD